MKKHCVVLGAGMIGVNVALRLAQRGMRVTLVDGGAPAAGTTGTSGSLVGSNEKRPWDYFELGEQSMDAMHRLGEEFEGDRWLLPNGHLEWADSDATRASLEERVTQLREWGYSVERLTPAEVKRDLEPELIVPAGVEDITFFSGDSIVYPHIMIALILRQLRQLGVEFRFGAGPASLVVESSVVTGIVDGSGEQVPADVVIACVGRWSGELLSGVGCSLPMVSPWSETPETLGLQVITSGVPVDVRRMIRMPGLSIRPAGGGRLMLHGRSEEAELHALGPNSGLEWDAPLSPIPAQAHALLKKATRVLENMQSVRVQSATASIRAMTADGLPAVGEQSLCRGHPQRHRPGAGSRRDGRFRDLRGDGPVVGRLPPLAIRERRVEERSESDAKGGIGQRADELRGGRRRLRETQGVAFAVLEPGRLLLSHRGDSVLGLEAGNVVVLEHDALAAEFGHLRIEVARLPAHLGVPGGAGVICLVQQKRRSRRPVEEVPGALAGRLEPESVAVEVACPAQVLRGQNGVDGEFREHDRFDSSEGDRGRSRAHRLRPRMPAARRDAGV